MLYKFVCNWMQPLYGILPVPYMPVRVTRGAYLVAHRYTYAPPRCKISQSRLSISLEHLADSVFDGVGLADFTSRANAFYSPKLLAPFLSSTVFLFSSFFL